MRQSVRMPRHITVLLVVLIVLGAGLAALGQRPDQDDEDRSPGTPSRESVTEAVRGTLPRDRVVRARVGDSVELTVSAREPDSATIDGLGLTDAAFPGAPARFSFRADEVGRFPVTLTLSGRRAGLVVVSDAGSSSAAGSPASR